MLVVIEGIDGSGKSTQVKLLSADRKISFPRYDKFFGKIIKIILRERWGRKISPYLVSFLFAIDRLMAKPLINGWLKEGKLVVIDRYTASSMAHQGAKLTGAARQKLIDWIDWLENKLFCLPQADRVIYLKVPAEVTRKLMLSRKKKDTAEKDFAYQKETAKVYENLAKKFKFTVIDCLAENKLSSKDVINRRIKTAVGETGDRSVE